MPAIQPNYKPSEIADQLQALKMRDPQLWRKARVEVTPFYDQFVTVENAQARSEREARYMKAMTGTIFGALATYNLLMARIYNGHRYSIGDKFGHAVDVAVNGRSLYEANRDAFLRSKDVNRIASGAVTFHLVTPARPRLPVLKHDQAAYDAAECCV